MVRSVGSVPSSMFVRLPVREDETLASETRAPVVEMRATAVIDFARASTNVGEVAMAASASRAHASSACIYIFRNVVMMTHIHTRAVSIYPVLESDIVSKI